MPKVMTLNLWRYHDWDKRIDNIVPLVQKEAPDCIAFQEVLTNHAFYDFSSADLIADTCGYQYRSFTPTLVRNNSKDRDGNRTQRASEGQAFISKKPIIRSEGYFLKYYPEYPEEKTVQFCSVESDDAVVDLCNIHLANSEVAYKHLDELLQLVKTRKTAPIILGDFNIYKLAQYKDNNPLLKDYSLSTEILEYISFPEDNDTLDYIAAASSKFSLSSVKCSDIYASDHKAVIADISFL